MNAWRAITEDDIALNDSELTAYRASLLKSGESDRLPTILSQVTGQVRGAIRSNRSNVLDPDPDTLPESAIFYASALVRYRLISHFPGGIGTAREAEYKEALQWLRDVAAGRYLVESPGEADDTPAPPKAGPKFTSPTLTQTRDDANG